MSYCGFGSLGQEDRKSSERNGRWYDGVVDRTAVVRSRSRRSAVPQYITLAFVLIAVFVYKIRYTAYRYPNWFHANPVEYSFF